MGATGLSKLKACNETMRHDGMHVCMHVTTTVPTTASTIHQLVGKTFICVYTNTLLTFGIT